MAYIDDKKVDLKDLKRTKKQRDKDYESKYSDHVEVLELLSQAQAADQDMREMAREAHLFVTKRDGQWEPYWWNNNSDKPRYTFDITSQVIDQIAGELEQASFDIRVSPAGGSATKDVALTLDGMIRNIENISDAKTIFNNGGRNAVTAGFDAWMVAQEFADDDSFDQDLMIKPVSNAIDRVWFDPSAEKQDKSDSRYGFVLHPVATDEYEYRWPDGAAMSVSDSRDGDAYYDKAETVLIGQVFYAEVEERELVLMSNGQTHEVNDEFESIRDELIQIGVTEVRRRKRTVRTFCSRFFDNSDWLEDKKKTVFQHLPIIPVYANYKMLENKTIYHGAVEKLIDPQRIFNYSMSREIEEGALAPRAKYWMTQKQAAGHETSLATLNTNSEPVQFYTPDPEAPGAPMQNGGAQINPGLSRISEAAKGLISNVGGLFASNMGDNPGLQSGVAITAQQNKGDNGTIKYFSALELAIAATGRILVQAIPKVYDTQRVVRVLYEDDTFDMADINQSVIDEQTGKVVVLNDLSMGKYDVVCSAGPAFKNRQTETLDVILRLAESDPSVMQLGGDILLNSISTPAGKQLAERRRAQMLQQGLIPVEQMTDEEKEKQQQQAQQQGQAQDPNMVIAQAEMLKGQAELTNAQTNQQKVQNESMALQIKMMEAQNSANKDQSQLQIDAYDSETSRMTAQVKASEAEAKIGKEAASTQGVKLDNAQKMVSLATPQFPQI